MNRIAGAGQDAGEHAADEQLLDAQLHGVEIAVAHDRHRDLGRSESSAAAQCRLALAVAQRAVSPANPSRTG